MKRSILILVTAFTLSSFFTSCRNEVQGESDDVEIRDDNEREVENAADDVENTLEKGVNEIEENTGTGGTDDNL